MKQLLQQVAGLARSAGTIMLENKLSTEDIHTKGKSDFVTEIDFAVNKRLTSELPQLLGGSIVVSEETENRDYRFQRPTWIIDPVDGTTNLIFNCQTSAISIGLVVEGDPVLGVVYNPYRNEMYEAVKGEGAFLNGQPISVNRRATLADSLIGIETDPYRKENLQRNFAIISRVFGASVDIRCSGSAALDLCYVACGQFSAVISPWLSPWDYTGGFVILREAGGVTTNFLGEPAQFREKTTILASNGLVHDELCQLIRPAL